MKREPKKWKYKRTFKLTNKIENMEPCMSHICFNTYGLVVEKDTFLTYNQLFTVVRLLKKKFKKKVYLRINVSCVLPFTKKPVSARMGKGKGAWKGFNVFIRRGTFLLEIGNIKTIYILLVLKEIAEKLPVKIKIVKKKN